MLDITGLTEAFEPIAANATCGCALDRFLDAPARDLLVVCDAGRPIGVITRDSALASEPERPVTDRMARPVIVDAAMDLDQACDLVLTHGEPVAGLVVVRDGLYIGCLSTRALMRGLRETKRGADRRFLDMISREMRAPMNGVIAVSELLQRQPLSADSQAFVRTILESAQATIRALNDAVDLSRVEAGEQTFKMSSVRLRELMDDVQAGWQARASRDGVTLLVAYDGEPELSVELDPDRMRQVLDLLVEGALTGASHGAVEVSLQARRGPDGIRLTGHVRDGGGGLLGRGLTDGPDVGEGPSLGVALCQKLIDRMGGVIRAENNIGAGSTVTFTLDVQETALERTPSLGEAALGYRGAAHVLVVDDNATNRMVAEALCEMFDCTSECAEDGVEAVEAARSGRFDLILMDIRMPRMDGVEATRAIRALPGRAGAVPIIALTANADAEDTKRYMGCGMHSVVEKPIKPERLLQAINAALPPAGEAVAA